jgi:hypothetical protein
VDVVKHRTGVWQVIEQQIEGAPDLVNIHKEVRVFLAGISEHAVADAALVVVMLAGDACRYGTPPVILRVRRSVDGSSLRIEVEDHRAAKAAPTPQDYRIRLLDRMTRARGVERHDGVTTTWVEIGLVTQAVAS